jgi:hypothetical protein
MTRIADIAHHFTWASLNTATKELVTVTEGEAPEPRKVRLFWTTMDDNNVCLLCEDNEHEYSGIDPDEPFLPVIPAHPLCRCWWNVEVD